MITAEDFEIEIAKKRSTISVWTLPKYTFELEKLSRTKYFLHVKENGEELFNGNNIHFEIHYEEVDQIIDMYFYDGKSGRYLQAKTDVFEAVSIPQNVAQCINKRFTMMRELFVRHILDEDTIPQLIQEEVKFTSNHTKDYSYCIFGELVIITLSRSFEMYGKLNPEFTEPVKKILNENGFFILSGSSWQNDGRYFSDELIEVELLKLGFVKNDLLKDFI